MECGEVPFEVASATSGLLRSSGITNIQAFYHTAIMIIAYFIESITVYVIVGSELRELKSVNVCLLALFYLYSNGTQY